MAVGVAVGTLGVGFLTGSLLVRFPDRSHDRAQPAPSWLAWTGLVALCVGFVLWAVALRTSPPAERVPDERRAAPKPTGTRWHHVALLVALFDAPLIVSAIVAVDSGQRWVPIPFVVLTTVAGFVSALVESAADG